jgi:hypothetical protein
MRAAGNLWRSFQRRYQRINRNRSRTRSCFSLVEHLEPRVVLSVAGGTTIDALGVNGTSFTSYGSVSVAPSSEVSFIGKDTTTQGNWVAGDAGKHTFPVTLKTAGTQSITATDSSSLTATESNIVVQAASAQSLKATGFPTSVTAGTAGSVTVTALDANGNVLTSYTGTVSFTSSDPRAVLPSTYTFVAADAGKHTFSLTLKTAGTQSITASDKSSLTGTESNITVQAAAATTLNLTGFPTTVTAGTTSNFTVTAADAYGNVATGYTGTVQFTSTDPGASLPAAYAFTAADAGTHSFSATLITAGNRSLKAADTVTTSLNVNDYIKVVAAAAHSFSIAGYPSPDIAGTGHYLTVTAFDAYGNVATGYTGTIHYSSSDPLAYLPANYTLTPLFAGSLTLPVRLYTAGTQSITATDTVTPSLTATQSNITVLPAAATTFKLTGFPTTVTAGVSHTLTVTAYDPYGNVATGYLGTVNFSSSDSAASLPSSYMFVASDDGSHTFTVTLNTKGTRSITVIDSTGAIGGWETGIIVQ